MLQFNVSFDSNNTMLGSSGGPARPCDHGVWYAHYTYITHHDRVISV